MSSAAQRRGLANLPAGGSIATPPECSLRDALARLHATRDSPNHVGVDEMVAGLFFILDEGAHAVDQGSGFRAAEPS